MPVSIKSSSSLFINNPVNSIEDDNSDFFATTTASFIKQFSLSKFHGKGWCADPEDKTPSITLTFSSAKIIEKLRIEKVGINSFPTQIRFYYANKIGVPLKLYKNVFDSKVINPENQSLNESVSSISPGVITTGNIGLTGSDIIVLANAIEARVILIKIVAFEERACAKIEAIGCQKTSCVGKHFLLLIYTYITENISTIQIKIIYFMLKMTIFTISK